MKPICIVQARMGSTRLPGKVMMGVRGKPLLGYLLERLGNPHLQTRPDDSMIIVATPDYEIRDYAHSLGYAARTWKKGPEADVAGRFSYVLDGRKTDTFIRICADSPLLDSAIVDAALTLYQPPYLILDSPVGCVEVLDTKAFLDRLPHMDAAEREHVTLHWNREGYKWRGMTNRLIVDTREDFDRVKSVIGKMDRPHTEYGWRECLALL